MAECTKESGKLTIWKDMVFISGTMEENMKGSIKMIKSMGTASISGQMEDNTMVIGLRESSMAWDSIKYLLIKMLNKDYAKMAKESVGLTKKNQG